MASILIVEDDTTLLTAVSDNFRNRGFRVQVATEGSHALSLGIAGGFDVIHGLELGADDYLTKPFSIRELVARVGALRRRLGCEGETVTFGECRLELAARIFWKGELQIELTEKEFQLLAFLSSRPNRALTRREILNQVWGHSVIVTGRSVDRCVTTLRSKMEDDPRNPQWIKTIRNIGYRFCR